MPETLFDKIWNSPLVARRADGREIIYIDRHVLPAIACGVIARQN